MIEIGLFVFAAFVGILIWKVKGLEKAHSKPQANYTELYRDFHELNLLARPRGRQPEKQPKKKPDVSPGDFLVGVASGATENLKKDGWGFAEIAGRKELIPPKPSNEIVKA